MRIPLLSLPYALRARTMTRILASFPLSFFLSLLSAIINDNMHDEKTAFYALSAHPINYLAPLAFG